VSDLRPYRVIARNTATESANKIHDDEVARQLGFRGGLVPGVDVYAYLAHPPAEAWGLGWLQRGTMRARFHQPIYDGGRVEVVPIGPTALELRDDGGATCATAEVAVAVAEDQREPPRVDDWPRVDQRDHPPPASTETLAPGTPFGLAPHAFHADLAGAYLDDVRETLPLYIDEGVAHPGWILRDANYVLSTNVRLGPWIHVESVVHHHGLVRDGDVVSARAVVTNQWERNGHRFVELDVIHLAGTRPVARTRHTAIYRPRGA
jgi:acyl-coenzyme A thioesterase PaaI-like protein